MIPYQYHLGLCYNSQDVTYEVFNEYRTLDNVTRENENTGELELVYVDGKIVKETSMKEIRHRVDSTIKYMY
jgi:hypothetical protein